jgi:hypothetical protein
MKQLEPGEEVFDRAVKVDEEEAARNEPPLRAPQRGQAATPPSEVPVLNSKARLARDLDPSGLRDWPKSGKPVLGEKTPLELAFQGAFSMREMLMSHLGPDGKPSAADDPVYHVKESMLCMAKRCDKCFENKAPTPRFSLQDEAQTELIYIDVRPALVLPAPRPFARASTVALPTQVTGFKVIAEAEGETEAVPGLMVRYAYFTASNLQAFVKSMEASFKMKWDDDVARGFSEELSRASGMQNMPSHLKEIALARKILEDNRKVSTHTFLSSRVALTCSFPPRATAA